MDPAAPETSKMTNLVDKILTAAKAQGISQREIASSISISPETLSRAKRRGSLASSKLEIAAKAANLVIRVGPAPQPIKLCCSSSLWSSPSRKNDPSMLHARLANASLLDLIELCILFGPDKVDQALEEIKSELKPAQYKLERSMLNNVKEGFAALSSRTRAQ